MNRRFTLALSLFLIAILLTPALAGPRDDAWAKVAEAEKKGRPKTAIELVEPIIEGALADKAYPEAVKAIVKKIALEGMIQGRKAEEKILRLQAEVAKSPKESQVEFRGTKGELPGIPVAELSGDQRQQVQKTLQKLIEPYRQSDRDEVVTCLKAQGGLDKCHLAFYTDKDLGNDGLWDNWRLEGPAFVWYFRGSPHVHVWVNVANDPSVKLNA